MTKTYAISIDGDSIEHVYADTYRIDDKDHLYLYRNDEKDPVYTAQHWWSIRDTRNRQDSAE